MRRRLLYVALAVSAAFNLGFVGTAAVRCCRGSSERPSCVPEHEQLTAGLDGLGATLREQLQPLRQRQASDTGRLAHLLAADEPDRAAISECLNRLSTTGREIHQIVVDSILEHQDALPEEKRRVFCRAVQQRLCDPWAGCVPEDCAPANHQPQPDTEERTQ